MAIDKSIDYVEQDGVNNYIKNSESVTVPKRFKARKNAPATKLAYITDAEAKMLKKAKKGTPHKGPKGIPSYDSFDAEGNFTSGAAMSAAETGGGRTERGRADMRAAGMSPQEAQDLRSAAIAAGAGQRVNPGFFDSRDTVSPTDLRLAKQFNPTAFRQNRGGIMNFITGGGITGNIIRSLGQRLGLGKRFNEPTYDMSQFNNLGLLTNRVTPSYYNDLDNEGLLSLINDTNLNNIDLGNPTGDDRIVPEEKGLEGDGSFKISTDSAKDLEQNLSALPSDNLVAFKSGTLLDRMLKNAYSGYTELGIGEDKVKDLMKKDIKENQEKGTPLSLPVEAYSLIG
jgi:hypothetical protein